MKTKKLQLIRIGLLASVLGVLVLTNNLLPKTAYAVGDLTINWGVPSGNPIFVVNNMVPGDCQDRTVSVTNSAGVSRDVAVRGVKTSEIGLLGNSLQITIEKVTSGVVYGPQTLAIFFTASAGVDAISLSNQASGNTSNYKFTVCFPQGAGNEFQSASVTFDLSLGVNSAIPAECIQNIPNLDTTHPIFGTTGNDRIRGNSSNNVIFGLEGNDQIDGGGGNDCIVGGDGNDRITDSTGVDVIFGNEGSDYIDAGSQNDFVFGGDGNDHLIGGSGNDLVFGEGGEDHLEGGSDNDILHGGDQNDLLEGGSGTDQIFGEADQDNLKGGSDNDFLNGGADQNVLNGDAGIDTCINGPTKIKCEL